MGRRTPRFNRPLGQALYLGRRGGKSKLALLFFLLFPRPLPFAQNSPPTSDFKISTDVHLVLLDVSVRDARGAYVSGLTKESFRVYENGVLQKVTEFSNLDIPIAVGLVMDDSGSTRSKRREVITAGLAVIGASNPKDQIFIVNFNDKIHPGLPETVPFTDNIQLLRAALSRDKAQGKTALYDAIAFGLDHLESGWRGKKALVVVSDGGDNCSQHTLKQVTQLIQESGATVYTVGIFGPEDPDRNPHVLQHIARVSGGESFLPGNLGGIISICKKIAKDIRSRYTVGYIPIHTSDRAGLYKIRLDVSAPDRGKLTARTRTSYLLPGSSVHPTSSEQVR